MGWWKIDSTERGGIDWSGHTGRSNANALPENTTDEMVNGDAPANIMGDALQQIRKEYKDYWKREPTTGELRAVFNFCLGGIEKELQE